MTDYVESELDKGSYLIPERMVGGIKRYILHGIPPGNFWQAVLTNDLRGACERADDENQAILFNYIRFLYNYAPGGSWGSPENYKNWLAKFVKED